MGRVLLTSLLALVLPLVVFLAGAGAMQKLSGRTAGNDAGKPLNQRWGYSVDDVASCWSSLGDAGLRAERRFLELDLIFPFAYGGALLAASLLVWSRLGRPISAAWLVAVVALTLGADWTENLVHLRELERFVTNGASALEPRWIAIASAATITKLVGFGASVLALLALLVMLGNDVARGPS
ncbi:MAG: hypothetical protein IPJ17_06910 [Holophagales bacterium]|nr:MAG: hypothetical protein IPJ17_06910 [Holophagales bacterium]